MVGFFSIKARDRAELLENETRNFGTKIKFKAVGKKTLSHESYEHLIQNLLEDSELIKKLLINAVQRKMEQQDAFYSMTRQITMKH